MNYVSARRRPRPFVAAAFTAVAFLTLLLLFAVRAQASETLYWNNYGFNPSNVAFANIDGSGGGLLNLGSEKLVNPEGMAYDTVTNRLFVANEEGPKGQILAINLDGSGAAPFTAPGAPIEEPEGVAVDPVTRTIYWENVDGESISWAKLDGSAGGTLNLSGATVDEICCRIAIDSVGKRVYWVNTPNGPDSISYANLDNSGGGDLNLTGSTVGPGGEGLAVDEAARRIYFLAGDGDLGYANLDGTGGGDVPIGTAPIKSPYGLSIDPGTGRLLWANEGNAENESTDAFGFVKTDGSGAGGLSIASAPVYEPQDPVIIKSPSGTGAPAITRDAANPAAMSCSTGSWAADYPGSFVYRAPRSYGYQWLLNGAAIAGATSSSLTATTPGTYSCTVTATNQAGSASQTSGAATVKATVTPRPASVKLTVKPRKAKAKPGKAATFKVQALNQGDLQTGNAKVCVKVPKKAKRALKAPKCKTLGVVAGQTTHTVKVKVKVKPSAAKGSYKVTLQFKGSASNSVKATVKVIG